MPTDLSPSTSIINAYLQGLQIRRQREQFEQGLEQRKAESESRTKVAEAQAKSLADYRNSSIALQIARMQAAQREFDLEQKRERMAAAGTAIGEGSFQPSMGEVIPSAPTQEMREGAGTELLPSGERIVTPPDPTYGVDIPETVRRLGVIFGSQPEEARALIGSTAGPEVRARLKAREKGLEASAVAQAKLPSQLKLEAGKLKGRKELKERDFTGREILDQAKADESWRRLQATLANRIITAEIRGSATKAMPPGVEATYNLDVKGNAKVPAGLQPYINILHDQRGTVSFDPKYKKEIAKYALGITNYLNAYEKFVTKWKPWFEANDLPVVGRFRKGWKTLEGATVARFSPGKFDEDLTMLSGMLLQAHKAFSGETASRISDADRRYAAESFLPERKFGWKAVQDKLQLQKDFFNSKIWGDLKIYGLEGNQLLGFARRIQSKQLVVPRDLKGWGDRKLPESDPDFVGPRENIFDMGWEEGVDYEVVQ